MEVADLVHKITWKTKPANLGIVLDFDEDNDPRIEWIIPCGATPVITYEYREERLA